MENEKKKEICQCDCHEPLAKVSHQNTRCVCNGGEGFEIW